MCGIVGLLAKSEAISQRLGELATPMLVRMGTRGPDSAGLAIFYEPPADSAWRYVFYAPSRDYDWPAFHASFEQQTGQPGRLDFHENHATEISALPPGELRDWLRDAYPDLHLLSAGRAIQMYKDQGHPREIAERFEFARMTGTHAVGHTRMATESAVSPAHAHPFTAGEDFCLVHNGSLSNPYSVRRQLERKGIAFETDNDTEAGCRYLEWRMCEGDTLEEAIGNCFGELDGFFTFLMATAEKMVLVRDAFACKPAVVAETDEYVAVSSEFRSLAHLPEIKSANVYEPAPERIYSWDVQSN